MAKKKTSPDEKLTGHDFNLWDALEAVDRKDYGWWDRLTAEQQRKFSPYMMLLWTSSVQSDADLEDYYLRSVDLAANKYFLTDVIADQPGLQWLLLCAASPGMGKQRHQWIPHLHVNKAKFKDTISKGDAVDWFEKIGHSSADAEKWCVWHRRAVKLANLFPHLHHQNIATLADITTDEEIENYLRELGE